MKKSDLSKMPPDQLKRLARWLGLKKNMDAMSPGQLKSLIMWLVKRREKKDRGLWG